MEIVINFSGGKDSSAMLAYICEKYPDAIKHCVFADTGWEHPDAEAWSRMVCAMFGLELHVVKAAKKDFMSMVERRGMFPGMAQRQCTSDLKRDPISKWIRANCKSNLVVSAMGLRAEESPARKKRKRLSRIKRQTNGKRTVWEWLPIQDWSETKVLSYLEEKDIPLHPVYKYLKRFSCRVCIFMTKHDVRQVSVNDPQAIEIISDLEDKIGFTMFNGYTIKDYIK